jgi:hypothetical protein
MFWIRRLFPIFFERLWTKLGPWTFIWLFQATIPMHAKFIYKWSFWDGLRTLSNLRSLIRFHEWIPIVVSTLFSYCTRSHSTLNCTYPWDSPPLSHDQTFRWNLSHCHKGNIVLIHKSCFMPLNLWCLCNTFFPSPIWSINQGWMWNSNPWHPMHLGPSPWLGYSLIDHGKCL